MTNEEKQALIEDCQSDVSDLERDIERCDAIGTVDYLLHLQSKLKRQQIALAALTAQPVKPPQRYDAHGFQEPAHVLNSRWIEAIRMAGYEVQE